ncbi:hypothetical protein F4861DRAFT_544408 [Xylaria intraflava]|nr:hypothetical protein F4861DRAFT_544408 [Xylaria intraflava]
MVPSRKLPPKKGATTPKSRRGSQSSKGGNTPRRRGVPGPERSVPCLRCTRAFASGREPFTCNWEKYTAKRCCRCFNGHQCLEMPESLIKPALALQKGLLEKHPKEVISRLKEDFHLADMWAQESQEPPCLPPPRPFSPAPLSDINADLAAAAAADKQAKAKDKGKGKAKADNSAGSSSRRGAPGPAAPPGPSGPEVPPSGDSGSPPGPAMRSAAWWFSSGAPGSVPGASTGPESFGFGSGAPPAPPAPPAFPGADPDLAARLAAVMEPRYSLLEVAESLQDSIRRARQESGVAPGQPMSLADVVRRAGAVGLVPGGVGGFGGVPGAGVGGPSGQNNGAGGLGVGRGGADGVNEDGARGRGGRGGRGSRGGRK